MEKKRVDIITCAYNESPMVELFFQTITAVIDSFSQYDFKVIVTNDGSTDDTLDKLVAIHHKDSRFEIINLSKNFGHEAALSCSINHSSGEAIIVMDFDLQDPPSLIGPML